MAEEVDAASKDKRFGGPIWNARHPFDCLALPRSFDGGFNLSVHHQAAVYVVGLPGHPGAIV